MAKKSRVSAQDPLAFRLNELLLPHDQGRLHIHHALEGWHNGEGTPGIWAHFMLLSNFDKHEGPLRHGHYADKWERSFLEVKARKRLDAEFGTLRRYCSLWTPRACDLISKEEEFEVSRQIQEIAIAVCSHSWETSEFVQSVRLPASDGRPLWIPTHDLTAAHASTHTSH